jgi:hypothetical protein
MLDVTPYYLHACLHIVAEKEINYMRIIKFLKTMWADSIIMPLAV